jgi:putative ubiquitin-RnfH superfamily antitoxin RatB of RatAB toxin-antitoxin module
VVAKLSKYAEFTPTQLNAIVGAAILNNQVKLIIDDPDVHQFLSAVIKGNEKLIEGDNLETLRSLLTPPKKEHIQNEDVAF